MPQFATHASFLLELPSDITDKVIQALTLFKLPKHQFECQIKPLNCPIFKVASFCQTNFENYNPNKPELEFFYQKHKDGLWLSHKDSININDAAFLCFIVLETWNLDTFVVINCSHTSDCKSLNGYGGRTIVVTKFKIEEFRVYKWVNQKRIAHNKIIQATKDLNHAT
ncbi:hypothetical protein UA38_12020 [Photobacterium kishitanii]|uniref:Uncharacterized protein n=1 Tax=Photobacterium kishitanii TaxID=318456 RepID=A0AAX0YT99_9GAMM|nr:hypothetical protein [Photobacterium kishitanii]KJG57091.1 hypothetical protein UA38_12020 [Photobacterium kishitanii]KJG60618.1 hypothetical protein UA42_14820 [Photobacterium kishitanii]KJG64921.1 hypothetical protein UA40_14520 [Photobacterium kishitanii]KJG66164.1 hypothetical protein UA41_21195 [Photobacterium kishitanii]PSX18287.1 hypothetical protein C0W70_15560 [Photobacterium kishitanii]